MATETDWIEPKVLELIARCGRADVPCNTRGGPIPDELFKSIADRHGLRVTIYRDQPSTVDPSIRINEARFTRNPPEDDFQAQAHLGVY